MPRQLGQLVDPELSKLLRFPKPEALSRLIQSADDDANLETNCGGHKVSLGIPDGSTSFLSFL